MKIIICYCLLPSSNQRPFKPLPKFALFSSAWIGKWAYSQIFELLIFLSGFPINAKCESSKFKEKKKCSVLRRAILWEGLTCFSLWFASGLLRKISRQDRAHSYAKRLWPRNSSLHRNVFMYKYQQTIRRNCTLCVINVMFHDVVMISQPRRRQMSMNMLVFTAKLAAVNFYCQIVHTWTRARLLPWLIILCEEVFIFFSFH